MKKLGIILILGMFTIMGYSQQVISVKDILLKDRIITYDGDTLISSFTSAIKNHRDDDL